MRDGMDRAVALSQALQALAGGRVAEAAGLADTLLQKWPDDASVQQLRATLALRQSQPHEAERWALASLASRPEHFATWMIAAAAARAKGDLKGAQARYRRASEIDPARPDAAFGAVLCGILAAPTTSPEAIETLRRRFDAPSPAWSEIGAACERAGQNEAAAAAYGWALEAQPSAKLHLRRGVVMQALGRRGEAAAEYQAALQRDPALAEAWFKLGLALQDGRRPAQAEAAYRRALALRPELAEAEANLGVVLQEQGDLAGAKLAYGRAVRLRPDAFGRVAQALTTAPKGELWLDLAALRAHLAELGRLPR